MLSLRDNLLTYIGYCAKSHFSYEKCSDDFNKLSIKHELTTLRKEFSLCKAEDLIDFKSYYHKQIPILSSKGRLSIRTKLPFKKFGPWDGKWRVVLFDLPQKERAWRLELVEKLEKMSFVALRRGAYISPYPLLTAVARLASNLGIRQHLSLLNVESILDEENLMKKWRIFDINQDYKEFLEKSDRQMVLHRGDRLWPLYAKGLEDEFATVFGHDPHLPEEFLFKDWAGAKAYLKFKEISNSY